MNPQTIIPIVVGVAGIIMLVFGEQIKNGIKSFGKFIKEQFDNIFYNRLEYNVRENPKTNYAILQELKTQRAQTTQTSSLIVQDYNSTPSYKLPPGDYTINDDEYGKLDIIMKDDKVELRQRKIGKKISMEDTQKFLEKINSKYNSPSKNMITYTSDGDKWSFPIFREQRNLDNLEKTIDMKKVIADVDWFMLNETKYKNKGIAYRRGYLLYGPPGTGKTTLIEIIAKKYGMAIYMVNLNSKDMNDTILINLISKVPPKSIIAFEEIDKQLATIQNNVNINVSIGGLLTAIDGPQRLSNSTIVILTANTDTFLEDINKQALLRKGRIDKSFHVSIRVIDVD